MECKVENVFNIENCDKSMDISCKRKYFFDFIDNGKETACVSNNTGKCDDIPKYNKYFPHDALKLNFKLCQDDKDNSKYDELKNELNEKTNKKTQLLNEIGSDTSYKILLG